MLGNPPRQRQRWGRQRQSPSHPRLCENHKRSLIGGPRKKGVQGVGDIGAGPAQPVLSLCAHPWCLFGFFLGTQKEARRRSGKTPQTRRLGRQNPLLLCQEMKETTPYSAPKIKHKFWQKERNFFQKILDTHGCVDV